MMFGLGDGSTVSGFGLWLDFLAVGVNPGLLSEDVGDGAAAPFILSSPKLMCSSPTPSWSLFPGVDLFFTRRFSSFGGGGVPPGLLGGVVGVVAAGSLLLSSTILRLSLAPSPSSIFPREEAFFMRGF